MTTSKDDHRVQEEPERESYDSQHLAYSLIECLPHSVFSKDREGRFVFANKQYCQTQRKTLREILGKTDFDLHPPALAEKYRRDDLMVMETGRPVEIIEEHQPMYQEKTYVQTIKTPMYNAEGEIVGVLGSFWDITEQRHAETAIRKSEVLYRTTIDSMTEMIYVIDNAFQITLGNTAFTEWINRYAPGTEPIGHPVHEVCGFLSNHLSEEYRQVFDTKQLLSTEHEIYFGGVAHIVEISRIPVVESDNVSRIITVIRDITERKQAEESLRENKERYQNLVENAPLGILSIDTEGQIIDVNAMLVAMFGAPSVEAMHEINFLNLPSLIESGVAGDFAECMISGLPTTSERHSITQWDKEVYLRYHLMPIRNADNTIIGVQAIIEDNTERKWAEEALKESEAEYRRLFKNMSSGLAYHKIVVDEHEQPVDYVFLETNEAFERLTGLGKNIIGKRATEVIRDLKPELIRMYGNVALTGKEETFDLYFESFGVWYSISAYSPEYGYFVALYDDITERKWAEESLRQMTEELEQRVEARTNELKEANQALQESLERLERAQTQLIQSEKMAALGGLVAGVAHEINTPLGIGVTAASYLGQKSREIHSLYADNQLKRSDLEKYLGTAVESAEMILGNLRRASEIIQSFKQVAVDQTTDEKRRFKLKAYIDDVLLSLYPKLRRTQHIVTIICPEELELYSYPGAFSQIITNLLMNALIHAFSDDTSGEIRIEVTPKDTSLTFLFQDNGLGMSDHVQTRIFEPFFTTKRGQGGSGLGLHIVYNLVTQRLHGTIECCSTEHVGTTFLITIPFIA